MDTKQEMTNELMEEILDLIHEDDIKEKIPNDLWSIFKKAVKSNDRALITEFFKSTSRITKQMIEERLLKKYGVQDNSKEVVEDKDNTISEE